MDLVGISGFDQTLLDKLSILFHDDFHGILSRQ